MLTFALLHGEAFSLLQRDAVLAGILIGGEAAGRVQTVAQRVLLVVARAAFGVVSCAAFGFFGQVAPRSGGGACSKMLVAVKVLNRFAFVVIPERELFTLLPTLIGLDLTHSFGVSIPVMARLTAIVALLSRRALAAFATMSEQMRGGAGIGATLFALAGHRVGGLGALSHVVVIVIVGGDGRLLAVHLHRVLRLVVVRQGGGVRLVYVTKGGNLRLVQPDSEATPGHLVLGTTTHRFGVGNRA